MIDFDIDPALNYDYEMFRRGEYRWIQIGGSINQDRGNKFEEEFHYCITSEQPYIPIMISTYGGHTDQLNRMIDLMETATVPIVTIAKGMCMSAGAFLLAAGTEGYRYAARSSSIMVHDVTEGSFGKAEDIVANTKAMKKYRDAVFQRFDRHTGQKRNYWTKKLKKSGNVDMYLTARQAKAEGIIDNIGIPRMKISISLEVSID